MNSVSISKQLIYSAVICVLLSACGGGIEGTSDGGPILPQPTDSVVDGSAPNTADSGSPEADSSAGGSPEGDGTVAFSSTSSMIPAALADRLNRVPNDSIMTPFINTLASATEELDLITNAAISGQSMSQPLPDSIYFDQISQTTTNDSVEIIKWSTDFNRVSALTSNASQVVQMLTSNGAITLRYLNITDNTVYQFKSDNTDNNTRFIQADLNTNGTQSYLTALINSNQTVAFVGHPTDAGVARQREISNNIGEQTDLQSCTDSLCENDNSWVSLLGTEVVQANASYADANNRVESTTTQSPIALPDNIAEAVLAITNNETPTETEIQCGIQQLSHVASRIEYFCVEPLPLENTGILFSETLSGGQIFYQRINQ